MATILLWKPVITHIEKQLAQQVTDSGWRKKYIAIIFLWDNSSSEVYVRMKHKFGERIWLDVRVLREEDIASSQLSKTSIITTIENLNTDTDCVGIILQLPLPSDLSTFTNEIYAHVAPHKDIDGLGGKIMWYSQLWLIDFLPATAGAVVTILHHYSLHDIKWKKVCIVGQSNLLWKPLAIYMINMGATVYSFNEHSHQESMKELCKASDYIISCTWVVHLINDEFVRNDQSQVVIDVGYGHINGKAVGDVDFHNIVDKVHAITPVPWWIWPLTVAQLFINTMKLYQRHEKYTTNST